MSYNPLNSWRPQRKKMEVTGISWKIFYLMLNCGRKFRTMDPRYENWHCFHTNGLKNLLAYKYRQHQKLSKVSKTIGNFFFWIHHSNSKLGQWKVRTKFSCGSTYGTSQYFFSKNNWRLFRTFKILVIWYIHYSLDTIGWPKRWTNNCILNQVNLVRHNPV